MDGLADLLNGVKIQRILHGKIQLVADNAHRYDIVLLRDILGDHLGQLRRDHLLRQIHELDAQLHLQRLDQVALRDKTVLQKDRPQSLIGALLQGDSIVQLLLREEPCRYQDLAQTEVFSAACGLCFFI